MEDGKRSAQAFPSRWIFAFFRPASIIPGTNSRAERVADRANIVAVNPWWFARSCEKVSI